MDEKRDAKKRIITFLILAFGLSAIFYALIIGARTLQAGGGFYTVGLMWCPGIAALVTTFVYQRNLKGLGWRLGQVRYLLMAYLLPVLYALPVYALTWLTGLGAFSTDVLSPDQSLAGFVVSNVTLRFLLSLLSALGEEIGWRGFLVPELAKLTTFTKTSLISGAIWAVWHLPLVLFAGYHGGTPLWFSVICFSVMAIGLSFAFAWLRLSSGSLWPAAVMHASHNLFIQVIFDRLTGDSGVTPYITGEFGLGLALAAVVIAFIFWRRPPANVAESAPIAEPSG